MAIDKLVDSAQLDADLASVANAIRTKGGTSAQLAFPAGFVQAIGEIETGGGQWTTDGLIARTEPNGVLSISTNIAEYTFYGNSGLTELRSSGNGIYSIDQAAFSHCTGLTKIHGAFSFSNGALADCTNLYTVVCDKFGNPTTVLARCTKLAAVDLYGSESNLINAQCFYQCSALKTLIIRRSNGICQLGNPNHFSRTPFTSDGTGGTLYVPQALIADYQAATNWSTILGYANNQILPIEGSIYETQYADGTLIE